MTTPAKKRVAVILAGAVAKGAYEAGVLSVLAKRDDIQVTRIVAASAGALNGAYFAYAVRAGIASKGADELVDLWREHAGLRDVFAFDFFAFLRRVGLSDQSKLYALLASRIKPGEPCVNPISLRLLLTPLDGIDPKPNNELANDDDRADGVELPEHAPPERTKRTTHEYVCDFDEHSFETPQSVEEVITAAVASASFPGAFVPVEIERDNVGRCIDGGTVNNTPVKWTLGGPIGNALDAVIVIAPTVEYNRASTRHLRGLGLIDHVLTLLIDERLYRDLRETDQVNDQLQKIEALPFDPAVIDKVKRALGWENMRRIETVSIRPTEPLKGNAFAGFACRDLREQYIKAGTERAAIVLDEWIARREAAPF